MIKYLDGKRNCVGAQIKTGPRRRSGGRFWGRKRWWVRVMGGGVEIVVDVPGQEPKVESDMAELRMQPQAV